MKEKLTMAAGIAVIAVTGSVIAIGGLYWLTDLAGEEATRWWAIAATVTLPAAVYITWRIATNSAREHLAGFERGLDGAERTIQSVGRGLSATASMARSARPGRQTAQPGFVPQLGGMKIIESQSDDSVVDL